MSEMQQGQEPTPDTQVVEGQVNNEPTGATIWTPDTAAAEIKALRAENAKHRKTAQDAIKANAEAEAKRLAEQGEYKTLYETAAEKAARADALQERLDMLTAQAQAANEKRIAAIPEYMRGLVPDYDDPLKLKAWLDDNSAVFAKPFAPPLDARAGGSGNGSAVVTDEEVRDFAVRMGINPDHVDRASLAKAYKR